MQVAIQHIERRAAEDGQAVDEFMVNMVVDVYRDGTVVDYPWPDE